MRDDQPGQKLDQVAVLKEMTGMSDAAIEKFLRENSKTVEELQRVQAFVE